jgi:phosphatidylglycerophosphate synthase
VSFFDARAKDRLRAPHPWKSVDRSLVSRALEPFWSAVAERMPLWLAPNAITLSGFAFVVAAFVAMMTFCPRFAGAPPPGMYALAILGLFAFQTLDAVDGKQARRTGTSSALGNWLDHVCDVVAVQLAMATVACSLELGTSGLTLFLMGSVVFNNFVIHWETKHTGTLYMGNGTSIYEAQLTLMVVHAVTMVLGPKVWAVPLSDVAPLGWLPYAEAPLRAWIVVLGVGLIGGVGIVQSVVRVTRHGAGAAALAELGAPALSVGAGALATWAVARAGGGAAAIVALTFATSLLGLRLIGRMILEHAADLRARLFDAALLPMAASAAYLALVAAGVLPSLVSADTLAWANLAFAAGASGHLLIGATLEMSRVLGIPVLTLPRAAEPARS